MSNIKMFLYFNPANDYDDPPLPWLCAGRRVLQVLVVLYVAVYQLWYAQEGITSIHNLFNV